MKAITLTQPWASLVAIGAKRVETRSWRTSYRGPLAIHAAKGFPKWAQEFAYEPPLSVLFGPKHEYPRGAVIATCRLVSCIPTREILGVGDVIQMAPEANCPDVLMTAQEMEFGDYTPGRWAWILADIVADFEPVKATGALSLWDWSQSEGQS